MNKTNIQAEAGSPRNSEGAPKPAAGRLLSMDAYRGLSMILIWTEMLGLAQIAAAHPGNPIWRFLAFNCDHVAWVGCSLHDLIQPSFSFLVGLALPYSLAARSEKGESRRQMYLHAAKRALVLVLLGVGLRTYVQATFLPGPVTTTYWTFEDTLSQIGLGYLFLFFLGFRSTKVAWGALAAILIGFWLAFVAYPAPGAAFDYAAVGVPADWTQHAGGLAAHFNKNSNLAWAFDRWFLNLFRRDHVFLFNDGGYATLNFIPTLGTMILGLIAGRWMKADLSHAARLKRLAIAGAAGVAAGLVLHYSGLCPLVKRIWTPSWTLFSGGACFLILAAFYYVMDVRLRRRWAFPLIVVGMNSIAAYVAMTFVLPLIIRFLPIFFGMAPFAVFGAGYAPLVDGLVAAGLYWGLFYWMHQRKIFIRV